MLVVTEKQGLNEEKRLAKCKMCSLEVLRSAKICPRCGIKNPGVPEFFKSSIVGISILIFIAWICWLPIQYVLSDKTHTSTEAPKPIKQQIAKKDGTFDNRPDDLDELCKDFVYYKAKSYKYAREGNLKATQEAQAGFKKTNVWLSQYHESDVTKTCKQYDTRENQIKYMR